MGATGFKIAGGGAARPPFVKGMGTKRLGKGTVKNERMRGVCYDVFFDVYSGVFRHL